MISPPPKVPAPVGDDGASGVVPGHSSHASAGVSARSAMVESLQRSPIIGIPESGARPEQLIERHGAVENIPAGEPKHLLQIERAQSLARHDACLESRRIAIDRFDYQIRDPLPMRAP